MAEIPSSRPAAEAVSVKIDELRILRVGNNNTTILPGTTVVYTLQVQPQVATTFLYNVSFTASGLPAGATRDLLSRDPGGRRQTTNITMTVKTATTALNAPPPSPSSGCRSPWDFCFLSWERERCEGGCGRFPHSWEWRCLQRQPDSSCGTERVFGCGPFRGTKSSLPHHRYGHRRNSSAHSRRCPCDPVCGVGCAVWEQVWVDSYLCLWQ